MQGGLASVYTWAPLCSPVHLPSCEPAQQWYLWNVCAPSPGARARGVHLLHPTVCTEDLPYST